MNSNEVRDNLEKPSSHVHKGHRERVKQQLLKRGYDHLYDHEILELLLFYAVPRKDTNPIAHELIERFGSLKKLMEADVELIAEASGIGISAAILIKTAMEMTKRYVRAEADPIVYYDSLLKVITYAKGLYVGCTRELSYALLFDNRMRRIDEIIVGDGIVNASPLYFRRLAEAVIKKNAASVILVHNHPDGNPAPSMEDEAIPRQIYDFLRTMSVPLLEHVIVSGREAFPMMRFSGQYDLHQICSDSYGDEFYLKFYCLQENKIPFPQLD